MPDTCGKQMEEMIMKRYVAEEKAKIVEEISKTKLSIKKACSAAGISDVTYYKWKKQLSTPYAAMEHEEENSVESQNIKSVTENKKGPKTEINDEVEKLVVDLKKQYPYYGVVRISQELLRFECIKISPTKVLKILEKNDLNTSDFYRARRTKEVVRFERSKPNELWSTDIMPYKLKNGDRFYFIGLEDDHSRFILSYGVFEDAKVENIIKVLQDAVAKYGLPKEILTDRGGQFHNWKGMSSFEALLARYGIKHTMSKPHNPGCNGKIESVHRNIQRELLWRKFMNNWKEASLEISTYINYYNHERPHQGIGGLTPADRYFKMEEDIKNKVLKANLEGIKVYFTGCIQRKMYRIEQHGRSVTLYAEGKAVETWDNPESLSSAVCALGGILKEQSL